MTNAMKIRLYLLTLVVAMLSSVSLFAQDLRMSSDDYDRYDGRWPEGQGILYSYKDGLIIGTFVKGKAEGRCVCYKPNGEVYWGDYRKGKPTGHGRIYRDNGIVIAGEYKNGRYHGTDTLYRSNGTVHVGKYRKGKLRSTVENGTAAFRPGKPSYPMVDLRHKQEEFLKELELRWEARNIMLREKAGFINPRFQGGGIDDFVLWVNSQVEYPQNRRDVSEDRTVIVEFTVEVDGTLSEIHAVFGSDPELNAAAEKAVSRSPKWTPGEFKGEKRDVRLSVPVVFSAE